MSDHKNQVARKVERRQGKRVNTNLPFQFGSFGEVREKRGGNNTCHPGSEPPSECKIKILSRLDKITDEIQEIRNLLGQTALTQSFQTGDIINLSNRGIRFLSEKRFGSGETLQVHLPLPLKNNPCLSLVTEVVWSRKYDNDGKFETGARIMQLSEENEDILIKYVFTVEREILKKRKKT